MANNNTSQHISNESKYVKFNPQGSSFAQSVTNVQDALASLSGDGVKGVPNATVTVIGKARFATQQEVNDGILGNVMVSPATLKARLQWPEATELLFGTTRYATNAEAIAGALPNRSIVASSLKAVLDHTFTTRLAKETTTGVIKLSTTVAATAGTDDTTAMTPLKTKQAIAAATALIPAWGPATESAQGVVRLATLAQLRDTNISEGYSASPATLNKWQATEANMGASKVATQVQMDAGTLDTVVVTAKKFASTRATGTRAGTVKLSNTLSGDATFALSAAAKLLASTGNSVTTGSIYEGTVSTNTKYLTRNNLDDYVPVGLVSLAAFDHDQGVLFICDGRLLNKNEYPELFARIGFTFGGDGNLMFAIPDMRGLFARGTDKGRNTDPGRGFGSYQEDAVQRIMGEFPVANRWRGWIGGVFAGLGTWNTNYKNGGGDDWGRQIQFDSARVVRSADETRPKSLALNYVICVK